MLNVRAAGLKGGKMAKDQLNLLRMIATEVRTDNCQDVLKNISNVQ